jgi:2-hydroxy-3-oxopropionate reductase
VTRIGFIGLGVMGRPMAENLLRAGHELTVHSRSPGPVDALVEQGAARGANAADVAAAADVVITMLPDSSDVAAVGSEVIEAASPGALLIDMSTISPAVARELAGAARARSLGMLDAPVSGGDIGARDGTLSIMVGGEPDDFERARPIFEVLGSTITHLGPAGSGQIAKACNQVLVAVTIEAISEALVLGSKAGVDPAALLDVLSGGIGANKLMEVRRRNFIEHEFTPGFRTRLHAKDLRIALDEAREAGVALPATALVSQFLNALIAAGRGDEDHSSLLTVLERLAGADDG